MRSRFALLAAVSTLVGCGQVPVFMGGLDSGLEPVDAGVDAGEPTPDAGPLADAGADAGVDAGPEVDPWSATDAPLEPGFVDRTDTLPMAFETTLPEATPVGVHAGVDGWAVVRTEAQATAWFGAPSGVDFATQWLLVYSAGGSQQGQQRALVLEAYRSGEVLHVVTTLVDEPQGCASPFSRARKTHVVAMPVAGLDPVPTSVRFWRRLTPMPCATVQREVTNWGASKQVYAALDDTYAVVDQHPVDGAKWSARSLDLLLSTPGSDTGYAIAARRTLLQFPMGHAYLGASAQAGVGALPYTTYTRYGACGRPSGDAVVVTVARPGNPLGLQTGDRVVAVNNVRGAGLFDLVVNRPQSGLSITAPAAKRYQGAVGLLSTLRVGDVLEVERLGMAKRKVTVGAPGAAYVECTDPLGRDRNRAVEVTVRPDGIAVIRLPGFYPLNLQGNETDAQFMAAVAALRAEILAAFQTVKNAPGLVWDVRGNTGGYSKLGLEIVSGMPTAKTLKLARCQYRAQPGRPAVLLDNPGIDYRITPGGDFAYAGKVAVVADGLAISAADYFLYGVAEGTSVPIFGSAGASAYGASNPAVAVHGSPAVSVASDSNLCRGVNDVVLEGHEVKVTTVDLDAADLKAGLDTQLEAAVKAVQ